MIRDILTQEVRREADVVRAHRGARQAAGLLGFDRIEQTRIGTAVSEIARNALGHGKGGQVVLSLDDGHPQVLLVRVVDHGPGIEKLGEVLSGAYRSPTGMGLGVVGARRLMDHFEIDSSPSGTTVQMGKGLPRRVPPVSLARLGEIADEVQRQAVGDPYEEIRRLNQELLSRENTIAGLGQELEDTNRGVMALYAELDERAEYQRRASELKTRLLSDMGHEIRTPLHSIRTLSNFLLRRLDGELTPEQERQVNIIRDTAEELAEFVDDLLDIARAEAGKIPVRPAPFTVAQLFNGLRGIFRPLAKNPAVQLSFADPGGLPPLYSDEAKVGQVLRNFISNALKFTEAGTVRVSAAAAGDQVVLSVSDTGIGIDPQDHERIFAEFSQIDGPLQRRYRGNGLGLPLTRRLAALLQGEVTLSSQPGAGSTFSLRLPHRYTGEAAPSSTTATTTATQAAVAVPVPPAISEGRPAPAPVRYALIIDDNEASRYVLRRRIAGRCQVIEAARGRQGLDLALFHRPDVIFLDLVMPDITGFDVLDALRADERTRAIKVIIYTAQSLGEAERQRLATAIRIVRKSSASPALDAASLDEAFALAGLADRGGPRAPE